MCVCARARECMRACVRSCVCVCVCVCVRARVTKYVCPAGVGVGGGGGKRGMICPVIIGNMECFIQSVFFIYLFFIQLLLI